MAEIDNWGRDCYYELCGRQYPPSRIEPSTVYFQIALSDSSVRKAAACHRLSPHTGEHMP